MAKAALTALQERKRSLLDQQANLPSGKDATKVSLENQQEILASLKACSDTRNLESGKQLHAEYGGECNLYVTNALINMYAKCGSMVDACQLFDSLKHPTVVSWTALILGYADNGQGYDALDMFTKMRTKKVSPNSVTFVAALKACTSLAVKNNIRDGRDMGKEIHNIAVENGCISDIYVESILVDMYAKFRNMAAARLVFDGARHSTVVSWNALILGYVHNGEGYAALDIFIRMRIDGPAPDSITLVAVLKACTSCPVTGARDRGEQIHAIAVEDGYNSDVYLQSTLVDLYAKFGSMEDAQEVFDSIKHPTVVSWNVLILGYADNGQGSTALDMFNRMRSKSHVTDSGTFGAVLKAFTSLAVQGPNQWTKCRERGEAIHNVAVEIGSSSDIYVQNSLVQMYAKFGRMAEASNLFNNMKHPDVVSWTAMILGYTDNGRGHIALELFNRMKVDGPPPDLVTYGALLKVCALVGEVEFGRRIHSEVGSQVDGEHDWDIYIANALINMYVKCGSMAEATQVFDSLQYPTVVSWNVLILGYADNGEGHTALDTFTKMRKTDCPPNSVTFVAALKACTSLHRRAECLDKGEKIQNITVQHGYNSETYVQSCLIDIYAKCGNMISAREVFDGMKCPDVVSWNVLILGYADNGQGATALDMFTEMRKEGSAPDSGTFLAALKACTSLALKGVSQWDKCRDKCKEIHSCFMENSCNNDVYARSAFIDMYAKCGSMKDAHEIFDSVKHLTVVCWNVLILAYADNGQGHTALDMFIRMSIEGIAPDSVTLMAVLKACTSFAVKEGVTQPAECTSMCKKVHNIALEIGYDSDVYVQSTLVDMYAKCGSMVDAREVFDSMGHLDVVTWTVIILGYANNGQGYTALEMFSRMRAEGSEPDPVTFGAALKACSLVGALEVGRKIHIEIDSGKYLDVALVTCLVDFYAKCGSLVEAQSVFDMHAETSDMITWNALLAGYSSCGDYQAVYRLFQGMQDASFQPDGITFLCILTCCSYAGLVVEGKEWFKAMSKTYGVIPTVKHYTCMIDLFGRANKLDDAMALLKCMPFSPDDVTWATVLSACRKWKNLEIGRLAFQSLTDLNGCSK